MTDETFAVHRSECESCRFFAPIDGPREIDEPRVGECRRYPPKTETSEEEFWTHWPVVSASLWCGEYARMSH